MFFTYSKRFAQFFSNSFLLTVVVHKRNRFFFYLEYSKFFNKLFGSIKCFFQVYTLMHVVALSNVVIDVFQTEGIYINRMQHQYQNPDEP